MKAAVHFLLFLLTVLEMAAGLVAGCVALAGLIAEATARALSAGTSGFARRFNVQPVTPRLRNGLAAVLDTPAPTGAAGGAR
ncbi:hypothetical protein [Actinacidiphila paucisporea]|uniref:Uncharacterized protein n=1 Tax=Actinacidiphila paucisporea TaxID=310782 RepID=A0A1M6TH84_9ACTN|nr:hypothetical protein [Actinacidiphila paucisporea]SHK56138.1 hypothetical protein SAMN05216499_10140 [Actinacidiphila paucisporea]